MRVVLALALGLTATVAGATMIHPGLGVLVFGGLLTAWALAREVDE